MSSHICLRVHFIWSTAGREPRLLPDWHPRLFAYFGTVLDDRRGKLLAAGGMPDHVHLYASLPATLSLADTANVLKANSSRWVKETFNADGFSWQNG
jgi:REP element-mobilizing transposase RayT